MALTPETSAALDEALTAVIEECGDTPGYDGLIDSLQATKAALADVADAPAADADMAADEAEAHEEDDEYSFEQAEKKHKAARKPKPKADGDEAEGGNPFAKKGE